MERKKFLVNHPSQLNSLSTLPFARRAGIGKIVFNDSFDHPNKEMWERTLNKHYYACGCSEGAKALLVGLFIFTIVGVAGYFSAGWSISKSAAILFSGTIAMSILGKLVGLMHANMKLKRTVLVIQSVWLQEWPQSEIVGCG